ncbi:MAG: toxin-antitoxin system HicB family antitoxin [Bacteroidota bacterium]
MASPTDYQLSLDWSPDDREYVVTFPAFPLLSVLDEDPQRAVAEALDLLRDVLADMAEAGDPLPRPDSLSAFSGDFHVRMPRSLHARLAQAADREGVSLNQLIVTRLAETGPDRLSI